MTRSHVPLRPLCFVVMPFGRKPDASAASIDFDAVYREIISPAVESAGLEPLRGDEEKMGGVIHRPMFERLILCPFAVADLTTANPNVYYELGVRHAFRPHSTVLVFAADTNLPFDVGPLRGQPYSIGPGGLPVDPQVARESLTEKLRAAQQPMVDSPVYSLLDDLPEPDISRLKADVFRDRVAYSESVKESLREARNSEESCRERIDAVRDSLGSLAQQEAGVLVDLLLSYRACKEFQSMVDLVERLPDPIKRSRLVQEQYGLALNRLERRDDAEDVLARVIADRGPSSETCGILGRVHKDRWEEALRAEDDVAARAYLDRAIETYLQGFQSDWRDAYPGVNCVTLMEIRDPPDDRRRALVPVVSYSVQRRIDTGQPDYWDHATVLELAILANDEQRARDAHGRAVAAIREAFEPDTTARNLRLIVHARERRGELEPWHREIEEDLTRRADELARRAT